MDETSYQGGDEFYFFANDNLVLELEPKDLATTSFTKIDFKIGFPAQDKVHLAFMNFGEDNAPRTLFTCSR